MKEPESKSPIKDGVNFTVFGKPKTKTGFHKYRNHYVDPEIKDYEKKVHNEAKKAMNGQSIFLNHVKMECCFFFPDKRRRDLQNYFKSVCDALEGAVYNNDSQIVNIVGYKRTDKNNPRVIIFVKEVEDGA